MNQVVWKVCKMRVQVLDQVFEKVCRIGDWEGVCIGDGSGIGEGVQTGDESGKWEGVW